MIHSNLHAIVTTVDTEQSMILPTCWRIRARNVNNVPVRLSLNSGEVAGGGGVSLSSEYWDTHWFQWLPRPAGPIYFAGSFVGARAVIEVWTQDQMIGDFAAYDFGYELGYES